MPHLMNPAAHMAARALVARVLADGVLVDDIADAFVFEAAAMTAAHRGVPAAAALFQTYADALRDAGAADGS